MLGLRAKTENETEYFVHDDWQIALMLNGDGSVKERLLWSTNQDELIAQGENFALSDHLNTVRDVVDADGNVIAHYDYDAFGKQLNPSSETLRFAYTGKLTDSTSGLQWNINRWYDANVGRWISEDPIGFDAEDTNLYRYAYNNNLIFMDSAGLFNLADNFGNILTPGTFELDVPTPWGFDLVGTLTVQPSKDNCCLALAISGGASARLC
ncbi:MAG: RHS repeat-associated core domain-containing protein [Planctomycetaceae bacterium]|jgi:RHS repeat-associated protein|nr:RHS repeat-associated core domain-containing protein [Planctomycetaceae bacterium]